MYDSHIGHKETLDGWMSWLYHTYCKGRQLAPPSPSLNCLQTCWSMHMHETNVLFEHARPQLVLS